MNLSFFPHYGKICSYIVWAKCIYVLDAVLEYVSTRDFTWALPFFFLNILLYYILDGFK